MKPLYIFDLDGTLALIEHRRRFVEGGRKDWRAFYAACVHDVPNEPVIDTMERLRMHADIWIFSGRSDEVRTQTIAWLAMLNPGHPQNGWLFIPHVDGKWVTLTKLGEFSGKIIEHWLAAAQAPKDEDRHG